MLSFQAFEDYYRFPKIDENSRLKVLENKVLVSTLEQKNVILNHL